MITAVNERETPIPVSEFSSHVERFHADRDKLFEMEYEVRLCKVVISIRGRHWVDSVIHFSLSKISLPVKHT